MIALALTAALAAAPQTTASQHQHAGHAAPPAPSTAPAAQDPHAGHGMGAGGHGGAVGGGVGMDHPMPAALGDYPMTREASGTAWQPDSSPHQMRHVMRGPWTLMGHAVLNGVYDWQDGPRGDEKAFVSGMVMGVAARDVGDAGRLQLRGMLAPDPFMGKRGFPVLLASGETADGVTPLVDRQHPHDLFMELSASYSHRLRPGVSVFGYAGLPGEPAFGPPAFMHRLSILDSPEAPISHHWLDSTHITFGVLTAGVVAGRWKLEASRFRGREPDEHRFDIETGALDSTAVRLSWNPTGELSLQGSWADVTSPEQLEPEEDQTKWSASAIFTRRLWTDGMWSTTLAWGRRSSDHDPLDAWVLESAVKPDDRWTVFARAERTENDELAAGAGGHHGPTYTVAKASVGVVRDFQLRPGVKIGLGGLYAVNFAPDALEPAYGGDPDGAMAFIRLKLE